jgi:23S rRNA (uridine2552-2'-O)-methyltransferase
MQKHSKKHGGALTNQERLDDPYYKKAKAGGFLARSIFKLEEIDKKFRLFPSKGGKEPFFVIDLGSSPGSWLQYICPKLNNDSKALGIDLAPLQYCHPQLLFMQEDIFTISQDKISAYIPQANIVLSDMAPKTSGIKIRDQEGSLELCRAAFNVAQQTLIPGGNLIVKVFYIIDPEVKKFSDEMKKHFKEVTRFKPESSRDESFEFFMVCKGYKK